MNALRLGHAHLKVRNLDRSVAFYREVFGLRVTEQIKDAYAFLTSGPEHHSLALQAVGANAPEPTEGAVGLYHIAFEAADQVEFREAWQRLKDVGVRCSPVDHRISWALYFTDPDGNGLEIYLDRRQQPDGGALWSGCNRPLAESVVQPPAG